MTIEPLLNSNNAADIPSFEIPLGVAALSLTNSRPPNQPIGRMVHRVSRYHSWFFTGTFPSP